ADECRGSEGPRKANARGSEAQKTVPSPREPKVTSSVSNGCIMLQVRFPVGGTQGSLKRSSEAYADSAVRISHRIAWVPRAQSLNHFFRRASQSMRSAFVICGSQGRWPAAGRPVGDPVADVSQGLAQHEQRRNGDEADRRQRCDEPEESD